MCTDGRCTQSRTFLRPYDGRGLLQQVDLHASQSRTLLEVALVQLGEILVPEEFLPVIPQMSLKKDARRTGLLQRPGGRAWASRVKEE